MKKPLRWVWMLVALPLYLPLRAQETTPSQPAADPPAARETPPPASNNDDEAVEAEEAEQEQGGYEERVSADNNLSFPVDI